MEEGGKVLLSVNNDKLTGSDKMDGKLQCYFTVNKLTTDFQHAYREGHSTSTVLIQMTDAWLSEIDDKMIEWMSS